MSRDHDTTPSLAVYLPFSHRFFDSTYSLRMRTAVRFRVWGKDTPWARGPESGVVDRDMAAWGVLAQYVRSGAQSCCMVLITVQAYSVSWFFIMQCWPAQRGVPSKGRLYVVRSRRDWDRGETVKMVEMSTESSVIRSSLINMVDVETARSLIRANNSCFLLIDNLNRWTSAAAPGSATSAKAWSTSLRAVWSVENNARECPGGTLASVLAGMGMARRGLKY
ncbi:hypothetical protein EDB87DRAFT_1575414 [Lactarius vividus]|nr:hypothetical protein EDB87DRAFT_1575414 [Lactarius vividus]